MNLRDRTPRRESRGPWKSYQEHQIDEALARWSDSDEALRQIPPPPHARNGLFPPRTGYYSHQATIGEVLNIDRYYPTNRSWVSGAALGNFQGERVYNTGEQTGQASSRYSMGALWT